MDLKQAKRESLDDVARCCIHSWRNFYQPQSVHERPSLDRGADTLLFRASDAIKKSFWSTFQSD
jgi:hypothetical protein